MMIQAQAAVLRAAGTPLSVEEVSYASPEPNEVVVKIAKASICHSDIHAIDNGAPHLPMIIGHEAAGTVESVGEAVTDVKPGEKVALSFLPSCGKCEACIRGLRVACERGSGIGGDGKTLGGVYKAQDQEGADIGQMVRLGAWSDRAVVHKDALVPLPDDADLEVGALLSCGFVTGAGAVLNEAATQPGDSVLIVGTGGVGIAAIQGAKVASAARIIAVDISDDKLELARKFGATHTVNGLDENWPEQVREITSGGGVDQAVNCIGKLSSKNLRQTIDTVRDAGVIVVVGAGDAEVSLLGLGRRTLKRTLYGSHDPKADQVRFFGMYEAGLFNLKDMVTARYSLDQVQQAVDDLRNGQNIRGVISFDD